MLFFFCRGRRSFVWGGGFLFSFLVRVGFYGLKDSVAFLTWLVPVLFCSVLFFAGGKIWIGEYYGEDKKICSVL